MKKVFIFTSELFRPLPAIALMHWYEVHTDILSLIGIEVFDLSWSWWILVTGIIANWNNSEYLLIDDLKKQLAQ